MTSHENVYKIIEHTVSKLKKVTNNLHMIMWVSQRLIFVEHISTPTLREKKLISLFICPDLIDFWSG